MVKPSFSDTEALVRANTTFAMDLYAILKRESGSFAFSPYSVSVAMAMLCAGARGKTADQIGEALRFPFTDDRLHTAAGSLLDDLALVRSPSNQIEAANSLWLREGYRLADDFVALLNDHYCATITSLDFEAAPEAAQRKINDWITTKTQGLIESAIEEIDPLTGLFIVNSTYFKGEWLCQFSQSQTTEGAFYVSTENSVTARMMSRRSLLLPYGLSEDVQILRLPYVGEDLSMVVLLPMAVDGLAQLEDNLTKANLDRWVNCCHEVPITVVLPRFTTRSRFKLGEALKRMGLIDAFSPLQADFSGICADKSGLFIGSIAHQACVEVNEKGTEAAAVTVVGAFMGTGRPLEFRANHPFVYLIVHEASERRILFMGRVSDPRI